LTGSSGGTSATRSASPPRGRWPPRSTGSDLAIATNPDWTDLLSILNAEEAEYLLVGGQAAIFYTQPRYTKDIAGLDFASARARSVETTYGGVPIRVLGKDDLIAVKKAAGRPLDLFDVERLQEED